MPRRAVKTMLALAVRHRRWSIALVAVFGLLAAAPAYATLQSGIYAVLGMIVMTLLQTVANLTAMILHILVIVAQYNSFINIPVVKIGWSIVNDVANMMFIIALLVIAIGTILRVENYRYNRLLGKVIVMAFLTNFSKLIAGFLIQSGQVVMLTFVNGFKDAMFGNFASMFGLDAVLKFSQTANVDAGGQFLLLSNTVMSLVAGLALMVVAMVVSLAFAVVLIVRIVTLWALVILSPLAFALRILPNTEGYAKKWWDDFSKWVVVGPVVAFFLWLALAILVLGQDNNRKFLDPATQKLVETTQTSGDYPQTLPAEIFKLDTFINFMIAIIFLMMGLQYATAVGGVAGAWAGKVATAGFAAGAVMTGLNAIRDRTVRPVQGFLQQRKAQGDAGVRDRTLALGARYDQAMGSTVGKAGRIWSASTAATGAAVKSAFSKEGRANFSQRVDEAGDQAYNTGTRGYQQSRQRVEQWKQARGDKLEGEKNMAGAETTAGDIMAMVRSSNNAVSARAFQEAMNRGLIDPNNDEHVNQGVRAWKYNGDRKEGLDFRNAMIKDSPDMARKVLFNERGALSRYAPDHRTDFADDINKYKRFKSQLQSDPSLISLFRPTLMRQKIDPVTHLPVKDPITDKVIMEEDPDARRGDVKRINDLLGASGPDGRVGPGGRGDLGSFLGEITRNNPGRLEEYVKGMGGKGKERLKDEIFDESVLRSDATTDQRGNFAEITGQVGRAFKQFNEAGGVIGQFTDAAQNFVNRFGGTKMVDMLALGAVGDDFVAGLLNRSPNVKQSNIEDLIKKSAEHNALFTEAQKKYYERLTDATAEGGHDETFDKSNKEVYGEQDKARRILMVSSHGEENRYDPEDDGARRDFAEFMAKASSSQVKNIGKWLAKPGNGRHAGYVHGAIGGGLKADQLVELMTDDYELFKKAADQFKIDVAAMGAGPVGDQYRKRKENLQKHQILGQHFT